MRVRARPRLNDEWIALPGLFDESEIADSGEINDLDVFAQPILQTQDRVLYGVYIRERYTAERTSSTPPEPKRNAA